MTIIARGEKIVLRPLTDRLSDTEVAQVYKWSCDPDILKLSGGSPLDLSLVEFRERLDREGLNPPTDRQMFFIATLDGEMIGRIGCFGIAENARTAELGVVIGERTFWGRGFGRDAITTMLRYLFETTPLERINLYTYPENVRAQKSFAACGFRALGTAQRFSSDLGEFTGLEMEITRTEFRARTHAFSREILIPQGQ